MKSIAREKKDLACLASARRVSKVTLAKRSSGFLLVTPVVL